MESQQQKTSSASGSGPSSASSSAGRGDASQQYSQSQVASSNLAPESAGERSKMCNYLDSIVRMHDTTIMYILRAPQRVLWRCSCAQLRVALTSQHSFARGHHQAHNPCLHIIFIRVKVQSMIAMLESRSRLASSSMFNW